MDRETDGPEIVDFTGRPCIVVGGLCGAGFHSNKGNKKWTVAGIAATRPSDAGLAASGKGKRPNNIVLQPIEMEGAV